MYIVMAFWTKIEWTDLSIKVIITFEQYKNDNIVYYRKTRMVLQCLQMILWCIEIRFKNHFEQDAKESGLLNEVPPISVYILEHFTLRLSLWTGSEEHCII